MELMFDVNYLAVVAATVASMVLGFVWYSDALFGKKWRALNGVSDAEAKKMQEGGMAKPMSIGFVSMLLNAFVLAALMGWLGATGAADAFHIAFVMWLGFSFAQSLGTVAWERKPWALLAINGGYNLAMYVLMVVVIGLF